MKTRKGSATHLRRTFVDHLRRKPTPPLLPTFRFWVSIANPFPNSPGWPTPSTDWKTRKRVAIFAWTHSFRINVRPTHLPSDRHICHHQQQIEINHMFVQVPHLNSNVPASYEQSRKKKSPNYITMKKINNTPSKLRNTTSSTPSLWDHRLRIFETNHKQNHHIQVEPISQKNPNIQSNNCQNVWIQNVLQRFTCNMH